jgi:hypothetical protein
VLLCDDCDKPVHAHCVGFTGSLGNYWRCAECEDPPPRPAEMRLKGKIITLLTNACFLPEVREFIFFAKVVY